ncbi:phage minor capsid protein [Turicibacter sanguinis]|uniref:phage minor capsid protein n=1 Tax=Turicibacter sanguinis TaxID=154288 RepID=UPI0021D48A3C|nr:phage minor capsid protein [Turicibacter sanguinis]MCU7195542.1 phage minor capsid protein [Turicibacter sanguinis]
MLTPDELAKLQEHLVPLYHQLEDFILEDIARRIKKTGKVTDTAKWQAEMAQENGISFKKIEEEVARITDIAIEEVEKLFNEASLMSLKDELALYEEVGLTPLKLENSPLLREYLQAAIAQTQGELRNITASMGFADIVGGKIVYKPIAKTYHDTLDLAQFQVSSGVVDYNTAIRQAVKKLSDSGLRYVDYKSGWSNRVDVAVRRATLTGLNQMANKLTEANMEHLDIRYVETTAHAGARPEHQNWQGQVFTYKGVDARYPDFVESTGYGRGDGICGWNCRHSFHPFIPGVSTPAYSEEDLKRIKDQDERIVEYNGKSYNLYQATQKQRQIETTIRKTKRELLCYNAAELKDEFTKVSIKLQRQKEYYRRFSHAAKLKTQNERHQVYRFDKSVAQKAVQAAKKRSDAHV